MSRLCANVAWRYRRERCRLAAVFADDGLRAADDTEVLGVLAVAGRIRRQVDGVMVEAVGQILGRDEAAPHPDRVTTRSGCRNTGGFEGASVQE